MNTRHQHVLSSGIVLLVGLCVAWVSFTQEPASAFVFPRLIASFFVLFGLWNFLRASLGLAKVGKGFDPKSLQNIISGLVLILVLVFFVAKFLGFYAGSFAAFLCLYSLYDPVPHARVKTWIKRSLITACFMAVIYTLFALLLQVQTPRGIIF